MGIAKRGYPPEGGTPVEVDAGGLGERLIIYQADGSCTSIVPAHTGMIAFNPLLENAGALVGTVFVWAIVNRSAMRVIVNSVQVSISSQGSFASVATLQRYRLQKMSGVGSSQFSSTAHFSAGLASRTVTAGLPQPYAIVGTGTANRYLAGVGALGMGWRFATGGISIGAVVPETIITEFVHGRVNIFDTGIFSETNFNLPFAPVTYLDQNEALVLRNLSSPSNQGDLIYGVVSYSLDADLRKGSPG